MKEVGIRALKQNASAVVAEVAAGETVIITDRGRPVAQILPLPGGGLRRLERAGLVRPRRRALAAVPEPVAGEASLGDAVVRAREDERY